MPDVMQRWFASAVVLAPLLIAPLGEVGALSKTDPRPILDKARAFEAEGKHVEALRSYEEAYEAGSREAAERLMWIHRCGWLGVRDEPWVARMWADRAAARGLRVPSPSEDRAAQCVKARRNFAVQEAEAAPTPGMAPSWDPALKPRSEAEALYRQALSIEAEGRTAEAIRIYRRAARAGSGKAARRLGDFHACGTGGASRDQAESRAWYETARGLGEPVPASAGKNC